LPRNQFWMGRFDGTMARYAEKLNLCGSAEEQVLRISAILGFNRKSDGNDSIRQIC
jgi:hypothetical protein